MNSNTNKELINDFKNIISSFDSEEDILHEKKNDNVSLFK
jgi:hypothetical protein